MHRFIHDGAGKYQVTGPVTRHQIITQAKTLLREALKQPESTEFTTPQAVRAYLQLMLANKEREAFACLFLDNRHRLIKYEELFYGTIDGATVHPREVVKQALRLNAAATIIAHNHPSGITEPSQADIQLTTRLKDALALVDVRLLDHFVVGVDEPVSFAERGLL